MLCDLPTWGTCPYKEDKCGFLIIHTRLRHCHHLALNCAPITVYTNKTALYFNFEFPDFESSQMWGHVCERDTDPYHGCMWIPWPLPPLMNCAHNLMQQSHNWVGSVSTMNFSKDHNHCGFHVHLRNNIVMHVHKWASQETALISLIL